MKIVMLWAFCTVAGFVLGAAIVESEPVFGSIAMILSLVSAAVFYVGASRD